MSSTARRWFAAIAILGFAAASVGIGVTLTSAQEARAPDLTGLRESVAAAAKRGANVTEVVQALDALERSLAKGFAPRPGGAAPAELKALRDAVETAGARGEKVDGVRTELEAVEKAMIGKALTPPKPLPPVDPPARPPVRPLPDNLFPLPQFDLPNFPGGAPGVDRELLKKAEQLRAKAFEMMKGNPTDAEAMQLLQEAQELMLKALLNGGGGGALMPEMLLPNLGRVPDRARLGVRMERLSPLAAEQLGLEGRGVAVTSVVPGSAAEKAGVKPNDIILEFAGKPVSDTPEDFAKQVNDAKAGEKVDIVVLRKGKKVELKGVELPDAPRPVNPRLELPLPDAPRPVNPRLELPVRPLPAFPNPLLPRAEAVPLPDNVNNLSVSDVNGRVTIKALQDGVNYVVTGTRGDNGIAVESITVTDGDKKPVEAKAVKDVPEQYRPTVETLLLSAGARKPRQRD